MGCCPLAALVLGENHRDWQRGGRHPCSGKMGLGLPVPPAPSQQEGACSDDGAAFSDQRDFTEMAVRAGQPGAGGRTGAPSGHDRDITRRGHRTERQPLLFCS